MTAISRWAADTPVKASVPGPAVCDAAADAVAFTGAVGPSPELRDDPLDADFPVTPVAGPGAPDEAERVGAGTGAAADGPPSAMEKGVENNLGWVKSFWSWPTNRTQGLVALHTGWKSGCSPSAVLGSW